MKNKINVLIIGFGSIGRRHAKILSNQNFVANVYIHSKILNHKFKPIKKLNKDNLKAIDYVIIANKTSEHYKTLKKINNIVNNIPILVEKPLFDKRREKINLRNKVFVGYNMRFNPLIEFLKAKVGNKDVKKISISSHSNLKNWRTNLDYSKSESAKNINGVLNDYSHEIDFLYWSFGNLKKTFSLNKKLSNLKIKGNDFFVFVGKIKKIMVIIELNFFSKQNERSIKIDLNDKSYKFDLINKSITKFTNKKYSKVKISKFSRNSVYLDMHLNILFSKKKRACTYQEGLKINDFLNRVK